MRLFCSLSVLLLPGFLALSACASAAHRGDGPSDPGVVHVAPPAGSRDIDRASILAAVGQARPDDVIQFAPGMYTVGGLVPVATPRVTLLGHPNGTILRGCDPDEFAAMERDVVRAIQSPDPENPRAGWAIVSRCGMFELSGGHVTVRNLTFEYSRLGLVLGCCESGHAFRPSDGGYLIEGNTFRNSGNSIRAWLSSPEPSVVRGNSFVNTFHALSARGSNLRFLDNRVSVPEPGDVPGGHPGFGVSIGSILPGMAPAPPAGACDSNVIAGNHVDGHLNGIFLVAEPGATCTGAVVRDNTIVVRRARFRADWPYAPLVPLTHESDSTFVGVPLTLWGIAGEDGPGGVITEALVEGNRILGAEGVGMELVGASRNRVLNNTITGVVRREPFPGNLDGPPPQWGEEHNGSGIWVAAGSDENEIIANTFEDIASAAIVVGGARNRIETRSPADSVRDEGVGNRIEPSQHEVEAYLTRFVRALNDESVRFLHPLYAGDATLTLADGEVFHGRDAIMRDYFRGNVARIRGLVPTSSSLSEDARGVRVVAGYTAWIAPATAETQGSFSTTWARQPKGGWLIVDGIFDVPRYTGSAAAGPIRSGMFDSGGVQLHYVDFGGEGVPIVFVHSGDRTGYTFMEFAPRFTDRHRVIAISQRGAGLSGGDPAPGIAAPILAGDVVALLDALEIDRAVIAGQWANVLIRLAEEYPQRMAGLVFLESHAVGDYPEEEVAAQDPIGVLRMLRLNRAALWGADPDEPDAGQLDLSRYRQAGARIEVPALSFVTDGASPDDDWEQILGLARLAESSTALFPDADVRAYFRRLAVDVDMQHEGRVFWNDIVAPAQHARKQALERAFGDRLRIVHVDPRAVGYGYRDAPDVIYSPIRQWLDEIRATYPARGSSNSP